MFDIGWQELFVIGLVTVIAIGPKELPRVLRTVSLAIRKMRAMAAEFQSGLNDMAREAELEELKRDLKKAAEFDFEREVENAIDPTGSVRHSVQSLNDGLRQDRADLEAEATWSASPPAAVTETGPDAAPPRHAPPREEAPREKEFKKSEANGCRAADDAAATDARRSGPA